MIKKKIDLIILAGGRGTRINKVTKKIPKPMIKFGGIPFIKLLVNYYSKYTFNKIYILSGYKGNIIKQYFKKIKRVNSIDIEVLKENTPLGTGGALHMLKNKKINDFFLVNGDSYFEPSDLELSKMMKTKKICSMLFIKNENYKKNKLLSGFSFKKNKLASKKGNYMNSGVYFFKKKILELIKREKASLETDIILNKLTFKKINIIKNKRKVFFIDIGTPKNLMIAKRRLSYHLSRRAVFFDRDGVINLLKDYICTLSRLELNKNIFNTIKLLNKKKVHSFIVTNQAGIAKGFFTEKKYLFFENQIKRIFYMKKVYFSDVKYCPYHINGKIKKYKKQSKYRKPGNLMIRDLLREWPIIKEKSIFIGDKYSDERAAKSIGLKFEYVKENIFKQIKNYI